MGLCELDEEDLTRGVKDKSWVWEAIGEQRKYQMKKSESLKTLDRSGHKKMIRPNSLAPAELVHKSNAFLAKIWNGSHEPQKKTILKW